MSAVEKYQRTLVYRAQHPTTGLYIDSVAKCRADDAIAEVTGQLEECKRRAKQLLEQRNEARAELAVWKHSGAVTCDERDALKERRCESCRHLPENHSRHLCVGVVQLCSRWIAKEAK